MLGGQLGQSEAPGGGQNIVEHHCHHDPRDGQDDEPRKTHQADCHPGTDGADRVAQVAADDEVRCDPPPARVPGQAADGSESAWMEESMPKRRYRNGDEHQVVVVEQPDDRYEYRADEDGDADADRKPPGIVEPANERLHHRRREIIDRYDQAREEERIPMLCDEERQDCREDR